MCFLWSGKSTQQKFRFNFTHKISLNFQEYFSYYHSDIVKKGEICLHIYFERFVNISFRFKKSLSKRKWGSALLSPRMNLTNQIANRIPQNVGTQFSWGSKFYIRRTTIFIFSFCIGLVMHLNGSALGVLKYHYITKRIREHLISNSRFLIYNSLNQLLYYTI